jgi:hypothetical protein
MTTPKNDDGGPAFPITPPAIPAGHYYSGPAHADGMSLRDYFAGQALAGLLGLEPLGTPETEAERAYRYADAMLSERSRR